MGRVVGFLDVGTNSARMLVVRINPNLTFRVLSQQREVIRLGEGEFQKDRLQPEAMERTVLICKRLVEMARSLRADEIIAVATSATRDASNREDFLRKIHRGTGMDLRVISGREEARLIFLGVSRAHHFPQQEALFIDIGGGSTEIILGDQHDFHYLDSLKLGAIRLSNLFSLSGYSGPLSNQVYQNMKRHVRNAVLRSVQRLRNRDFSLAFGSSGTIQNLAEVAGRHFGEKKNNEGLLTPEMLRRTIELLRTKTLEERRKVAGLNPEKADIIVPGASILETLMEDLQIPSVSVTDRGLRNGLLVDYLLRTEFGYLDSTMSVRERSVLQLARSCGFQEAHARQVARLALTLFDSGREAGLFAFGEWERELLYYSALLHDVGMFLSFSGHQDHTYYIIRNAELLGFDQKEIGIMAALGYYHRKKFPKAKHTQMQALDKSGQRIVRKLALLLRIAETLDRSHGKLVDRAAFLRTDDGRLTLELYAPEGCDLELWGLENHRKHFFKAFEESFRTRIVHRTEAVS
ncbi:MAG: Ppx/GppA family phosphatase [Synergistales bacterium]|nr:Ppx/GppA family phosphatase [Synergistales bacterium]